MTTNRPLKVFLCHSSADKTAVRELYQKLRAESWIDPWLDEIKLLPGQEWDLEIEQAIEATDIIIVCLSNNSITKRGYVQKEIKIALDYSDLRPEGEVFIVPIRLDDCKPPKRLSKWQYADYFEGQRDEAFKRLLSSFEKRGESLGKVKFDKPEKKNDVINTVVILEEPRQNIVDIQTQQIVHQENKLKDAKKFDFPKNKADHHTALFSEVISSASSGGVKFLVSKLQWGKNDFGYSLHVEPTSFSLGGMQSPDFLSYLGFQKESCQFVSTRICYTTWVDGSFDISKFAIDFGEAFSNFDTSASLFRDCGYFLDQPEGLAYFGYPTEIRMGRTKSLYGGDGHNASSVRKMKQSEDEDFYYQLSWIERANSRGWVTHCRTKNPLDQELLSVLKFLDFNVFSECPLFDFEKCFWMFIEYHTRSNSTSEGNAEYAHRCYDSHANKFSKAARKLIKANNLMAEFGFHFLNS
ncbi:MAG: toll/interleukin-1 receptor domain-containing protein [Anaerolineales bacterium]